MNARSDEVHFEKDDNVRIVNASKSASLNSMNDEHGVPFSPFTAGATLINLILATGPFSYPDSYVKCSPLLGTALMTIVFFLAYMTVGFMIEALAISCAMRHNPENEDVGHTIYPSLQGEYPSIKQSRDEKDEFVKCNSYYIREKIEISNMWDDHIHPYAKYFVFVIIAIYMYGAMILNMYLEHEA